MTITINTMRKFSEVNESLFTSVDCTYDDGAQLPRAAVGVVDVVPIERACVAIYADYPGLTPGIGTAVGVLRLITGLVLSIIYSIASCCISNEEKKAKYHVSACIAFSEAQRGIWEIFPLIAIVPYIVCRFHFQYRNPQSPQVVGKMSNMSHGNFIYAYHVQQENGHKAVEILYSWARHTGPIIVLEKTDRPDSGEIEAIFIDPLKRQVT